MGNAVSWLGGTAVVMSTAAFAGVDAVTVGDVDWHRSEWRASTFSSSTQSQASLAVDRHGGIVTVWSSRRQQGGRYGVFGQRFDARGVVDGGETCVNLWTDSHQWAPAIADGAAGTWVAWQSHAQDGDAGAIIARRFDAGWTGGDEILVNTTTRGHQSDPVIVAAPDGGALVVWISRADADSPTVVRGQRLDVSGHAIGAELSIADDATWHQRTPVAAFAPDGSFVIVYAAGDGDPAFSGIRLQRFDARGCAVGAPHAVPEAPRHGQLEPAVAATPTGYVVAWVDAESDGGAYGVLARRLDHDGAPVGASFVVNERCAGTQNAAAIAVADDGRFAIAYNGTDADGTGVLARLFAADGRPLASEFRINAHEAGDQTLREAIATERLAFNGNGGLVCVWSGDAGLGDDSAVHVTMLAPEPVALAGAVQGVTPDMAPAVADTLGAAPHEPPTFDPAARDKGAYDSRMSPGGDFGFTAVVNTGWTPPDPHGAAGPEHIVVMTNGEIAFYTKDGTRTFVDEIEGSSGFWGSVGASGFVFDPEVLYDPLSERFFVMAADRNSATSKSYALVGVSDDSDPNGTWHKYAFETTALAGTTFDSPNIGVDADVVYITGDGFPAGNYPVFTYDKASLLNGDPPAISRSTVMPTSTQSAGIPPVTFDDPPALYMAEHREGAFNTAVRLIALTDPLGTITFTDTMVTVPSYGRPEDPPQAGTSSRPNTFDARFWSVAYRNGSLWATHHINSDRVLARWYEFAMNGWPESGELPELVQSGEIDPGGTVRTFFTAITADAFGNAALTYSRSSPSEFISMRTAYRYKSDPLGTFQDGIERAVNTSGYSAGRWGDYAAINVDPVDGKTMWAHHEYAIGSSWRTWVQGFTPFFKSADVNCDGVVDTEDLLAVISAWGPCDGCPEDTNDDGVVATEDLLAVLAQWD
jgi:hypothetical protein